MDKKKTHHGSGKHPNFSETDVPEVKAHKNETGGPVKEEALKADGPSSTETVDTTDQTNEKTGSEAEVTQNQMPKEEDMTESTAKTIEVDEAEMLFTKRKIRNLEDENKKLNNEVTAFKERLLRLNSEYENFRKRTVKEKEEIGAESTVAVLRDILPVIDNLERALVTETDDLPGLKEGVQMTLDQFIIAMEKLGVEMIPTDNGFDPNYHDAVMHETDPTKGPRVVSQVFLKGYKKDDKVVRHAVVKVAN